MEGLEGKRLLIEQGTLLEVMEMSTVECGDCCKIANVDSYTFNG